MADAVEWWGLAISAFAALGVLYLVAQTLYDAFPDLSYKLDIERNSQAEGSLVQVTLLRSGTGPDTRMYGINFVLWNRTSRTARLQTSMSIPTARNENRGFRPPGSTSSWRSFANERLLDRTSQRPLDRLGFDIGPGNGRELFLQGDLRPGEAEPAVIEFGLRDDRIGRRRWNRTLDLIVPVVNFDPPPALRTAPSANVVEKEVDSSPSLPTL